MKCSCVEWSDGAVYGERELADPDCKLCLGAGEFTERDQQRLKDMAEQAVWAALEIVRNVEGVN